MCACAQGEVESSVTHMCACAPGGEEEEEEEEEEELFFNHYKERQRKSSLVHVPQAGQGVAIPINDTYGRE